MVFWGEGREMIACAATRRRSVMMATPAARRQHMTLGTSMSTTIAATPQPSVLPLPRHRHRRRRTGVSVCEPKPTH